ncbi:MAG TPA: chorismate lyase [Nitrospiria bacterium]|jgi:chorismate-pyruvate lyase
MAFSMHPTFPWTDLKGLLTLDKKKGLNPLFRLILTSDGTVTRLIEILTLHPVTVEMISHKRTPLEKEEAYFLELDPGKPAIERTVWLRVLNQRLVFATSFIPMEDLNQTVYDRLEESKKSLGTLISEFHFPVIRDKMSFCQVLCPEIAQALEKPPLELFWARRYRLKIEKVLQAFIIEVFSPHLETTPYPPNGSLLK